MRKKSIYFDNAAATLVDRGIQNLVVSVERKYFANPSGLSLGAQKAAEFIRDCKKTIAGLLHTQEDTLFFTHSGTHSINLALQGFLQSDAVKHHAKTPHVVTTNIEHSAVRNTLRELESQDRITLTEVGVDREGLVSAEHIMAAIRPETVLVSIMMVNNEIGTIEKIDVIGREILKQRKSNNTPFPYFHSDACQAPSELELQVEKLHVDLLCLNGSKMHAPRGTGLLYKRRNVPFAPIEYGGGQQQGIVPGTQDVARIAAFSQSFVMAQDRVKTHRKKMLRLSQVFLKGLRELFPDVQVNGPEIGGEHRAANNLHVSFPGVDGEQLAIYLDAQGVVVGLGSACTAFSDETSHVLTAIGMTPEQAKSSIRITFGKQNTLSEVKRALRAFKKVKKLLYA
ncbi:cysteine desulfurase [Candidatus Nomurabacteria bacterium]|nr:cysteine desulfurase [Candidatus Nomurabacteria bacterium]